MECGMRDLFTLQHTVIFFFIQGILKFRVSVVLIGFADQGNFLEYWSVLMSCRMPPYLAIMSQFSC